MAFAANSVLCRVALVERLMDPVGFTTVRLGSGAVVLLLLMISRWYRKNHVYPVRFKSANMLGTLALFVYAMCFSLAYIQLETGAGALVLFGAVQLTLAALAFINGNKPKQIEFLGAAIAFTGLIYLLSPTWGSPRALGFFLMFLAGMAWAVFTWVGKGSKSPTQDTSLAFIGCLPLLLIVNIWWLEPDKWTVLGVVLAIASGAITSAMGYALWYSVLPKLSAMQAGIIQLLVPIIAAIGGVVFIGEGLTQRLVVATLLVIGGVYLSMMKKNS